ncbi:glyoxalase [Wenyingzhuangia sp. IMCC45533]
MTKQDLRPTIANAVVNDNMFTVEQFQNGVLRPVIKMQHNLIIALFCSYLKHSNFEISALDKDQKKEFLKNIISKNQHLRNQYVGLISGMFTDEEFEHYLTNSSEYGRRIIQMISQRLQDTL